MARNRRLQARMHPNVVPCAVTQTPGAVAPQPALELSALHSGDVCTRAVTCGDKPLTQVAERLDEPCLSRERDPLSKRRLVRKVVQRVEHVDPSLVLCTALGD